MTPQLALDLAHQAMVTAGKMCAPILLTAIVCGVVLNIVQTVTSIRDMSLTFVPKLVAAMVVIGFTLPWSVEVMTNYFQEIYSLFGSGN